MTDTALLHQTMAALCRVTLQRHPPASHAYLPPLVNYTHEDAEAKGLRKLVSQQESQLPVHFTALEMAAREPLLFLSGARGSGKTTFALHLVRHLAGAAVADPHVNLATLARPVARNNDGTVTEEHWSGPKALPCYVVARGPATLAELLEQQAPDAEVMFSALPDEVFLLVIDAADRLGSSAPSLLQDLAALAARHTNLRLLICGASDICHDWALPAAFRKHALLPLLTAQRQAYDPRPALAADDAVLGNTGLFLLSLALPAVPATDYALVGAWLEHSSPTAALTEKLVSAGFARYAQQDQERQADDAALADELADELAGTALTGCLEQSFLLMYLAAQHLAGMPARQVAALFYAEPDLWRAPIKALVQHWGSASTHSTGMISALMTGAGAQGMVAAVLVADLLGDGPQSGATAQRDAIRFAMQQIVEDGTLTVALREQAGRHLARYGDRRELEALVHIKAGSFVMGSAAHPNSNPPHRVMLGSYRIGQYPVTNRLYGAFIAATGRHWHSVDGLRPERGNGPAVDLSWHDARAFCDWLTASWRARNKIAAHEAVRLPSEPEWEYAARGAQPDDGALVYPWGGAWGPEHCNGEASGFNDTCAVGLFPSGRSPFGCYDMAGQVWEWTTTLWGSDMATPSFLYPYQDDGREDLQAAAEIRRVLRGGCFSSGAEKANCSYRGSLEPNGFWRGNGFRIVVAVE